MRSASGVYHISSPAGFPLFPKSRSDEYQQKGLPKIHTSKQINISLVVVVVEWGRTEVEGFIV